MVAVTVAAPGWSVTVDDGQISRWSANAGGQGPALTMLIEAAWTEGEARERGIVVSDEEVRQATEERKPTADELFVARHEILEGAVNEQVARPAALSVTPADVDAYVDQHPHVEPARTLVRRVVARTRARAQQARRALERGGSWSLVTRRYSTTGPGLKPATATEQGARQGVLNGPVKVKGRYVVYEVVKVVPAKPLPRSQQEATAWEILAGEAQRTALDAFEVEFRAKWRARTTCAPQYAANPDCGNTQQPPTGGLGS